MASYAANQFGMLKAFGPGYVVSAGLRKLFGAPTEIAHTPRGFKHPFHMRMATTDLIVYRDIFLGDEYRFDLPFEPRTIIDAGANIGATSVFFANRYPRAQIIAIEPEPGNFKMLQKNTRPYPQIIALHAALWPQRCELLIGTPKEMEFTGEWGFRVQEEGTPVRAISMRDLIAQYGQVDVLKMDIEGAEKEVFESCDWLDSVHSLMVETHDRFKPGCSEAVNRQLRNWFHILKGHTDFYVPQPTA